MFFTIFRLSNYKTLKAQRIECSTHTRILESCFTIIMILWSSLESMQFPKGASRFKHGTVNMIRVHNKRAVCTTGNTFRVCNEADFWFGFCSVCSFGGRACQLLQSHLIPVNVAACLRCRTEEQPACLPLQEKGSLVLKCRAAAVNAARLTHTHPSWLVFLSNALPHSASSS